MTGEARAAGVPEAISSPGMTVVAQFHAVGDQIYGCQADKSGALSWVFREPLATLLDGSGKTVGRHFAGPRWMLDDGSWLKGATVASAPGTSPDDVAWLKLKAVEHGGSGMLSDVSVIQRINVKGGQLAGRCRTQGELKLIPYSADYIFLKP